MTSQELRQKFLKFFEKNDHVIIPSASLVPAGEEQLVGKEKVLFTSAGMQPLIPYLMGKPHPQGKRLADVQKCLRTDDIEEVGDAVHHTFFEMLGNWSLGEYWKDGAIELSFKFLREELNIPLNKLAISVFAGDEDAPRDEESANKWKSLGVSESRIAYLGKEANWWPTPRKDLVTGELKNAFGPCGPDTEMFIWTRDDPAPDDFDPKDSKWVEVWNDVFMEFNRSEDGTLEELPQKNVDTGMGLERMLAVLNGKDNDYETDLFLPLIGELSKSNNEYDQRSKRIIVDHLRASIFLMAEGIEPQSNEARGSILVRLLSTAITQNNQLLEVDVIKKIIDSVVRVYSEKYKELEDKKESIYKFMEEAYRSIKQKSSTEELKKALLVKFTLDTPKSLASTYAGNIAFDYHQKMGTPQPFAFGTASELSKEVGLEMDKFRKGYEEAFQQHQQISKGVEAGKFKGGLADHSETVIKYHTATHLLHQALRDILGPSVFQKGSNITSERLRFDFSYDKKMTPEEIKKVEEIINKRIEEDLKIDHMIVSLDKAKEMNAIGLFDEKYADKVSIYGVGLGYGIDSQAKDQRDRGGYYSLEFCGGPHVEQTSVIGKIKIIKEEAISAGMRRIRTRIVSS